MRTKHNRWSKSEEQYLRANCGVLTDEEMAAVMTRITGRNITVWAIHEKRRKLRLRKQWGGKREAGMAGRIVDETAGLRPRTSSAKGQGDRNRPVSTRGRKPVHFITAFGETKSLSDWASDPRCEVRRKALRARIGRGMSGVDCLLRGSGRR